MPLAGRAPGRPGRCVTLTFTVTTSKTVSVLPATDSDRLPVCHWQWRRLRRHRASLSSTDSLRLRLSLRLSPGRLKLAQSRIRSKPHSGRHAAEPRRLGGRLRLRVCEKETEAKIRLRPPPAGPGRRREPAGPGRCHGTGPESQSESQSEPVGPARAH